MAISQVSAVLMLHNLQRIVKWYENGDEGPPEIDKAEELIAQVEKELHEPDALAELASDEDDERDQT